MSTVVPFIPRKPGPPVADIINAYLALPELAATLVRILAVNMDTLTQYQTATCLQVFSHQKKGLMKPVASVIQGTLKKLADQGVILKTPAGCSCREDVGLWVVRDLVKKGEFNALAASVQKVVLSENPSYAHKLLRSFNLGLRDLQCLVYRGEGRLSVDGYLRALMGAYPVEYKRRHPLIWLFNRPFDAEAMDAAPEQTRFSLVTTLVNEAQFLLEPAEAAMSYLSDRLSLPAMKPYLYRHCHALMFAGHLQKAREAAALLSDGPFYWQRLLVEGWIACVTGDAGAALAAFQEAERVNRKMNKNNSAILTGYPGLFYLLALLKEGGGANKAQGAKIIRVAAKSKEYNPAKPLMLAMRPLFQDFSDMPVDSCGVGPVIPPNTSHIDCFFYLLAHAWTGAPPPDREFDDIAARCRDAQQAGLVWVAAEYHSLLAKLGADVEKNRDAAGKLHKACGTVSLVDLFNVQQPWEKVLHSLIAFNQDEKVLESPDAAVQPEQRLIWLLAYLEDFHACRISPKLQKRTKRGGWTEGRAVALKTLFNDSASMEGLTDQDRLVCRAIGKYASSYGYYGQYGVEYRFDLSRALPALVGHPLLMLESSPGVHVELVTGRPEVHVEKTKTGLRLEMVPMPDEAGQGIKVVRETPTRFRLVRFSPEHQRIARLLKPDITIPTIAEPLVREAVGALSGIVSVQSDLAGVGKIRDIPADPTPYAHVMPFQGGVKLVFLVKPLGEQGPCFTPGRGGKIVMAVMDGEKVQARRQLSDEQRRFDLILEKCPVLAGFAAEDDEWVADNPEDALEILLALKACEGDMRLAWPQGETLKVHREVSFGNLSLAIHKDRDWFKATGALNIDPGLSVDLKLLMERLDQARGRFVPLDDGVFVAVTRELRKRLEELKAFTDPHRDGLRFSPLAAPALEGLTGNLADLKTDAAWKEHCNRLSTVVSPKLPSTFQANLREYQQAGFNWLAQLSHWGVGACLADDMGLGKTVQALAAILLTAAKGPSLVAAPLSVMGNWEIECRRFTPTLNVSLFGPGDRQAALDALGPFDLLICSYGLLAVEAEKLAGVTWEVVVLDEAQAIKNMNTQRSRAAMNLNARFRIVTTGTPLENHLGELWTLFHFLNPGLLGGFKRFNERFIIPIERDRNKEAGARLRKLIRPFLLRRLKSEVLQELPSKTEITLQVEMSPEEAALYEVQRTKSLEAIAADNGAGPADKRFRILAEIMRLRRLCCNPALLSPEIPIASSKLKVFGDVVAELLQSNHKALVFSQFVDHLALIRAYLDGQGIHYQYLDGSTPAAQRKERINAFQSGDGDLFLISLKAGGFGLNLTAADYVIHMDPWWNPAVEDQASDRAHRIGQQRPVTVYRLVVKNTIEDQIVGLHKEKRELADSILTGGDAAGRVSADELLRLLKGK